MGKIEVETVISVVVTVAIFVVGGVMKWIDRRISAVENTIFGSGESDGHDTKLAVLKACQENTAKSLEDIKESVRDNNAKLDQVLLALQKP